MPGARCQYLKKNHEEVRIRQGLGLVGGRVGPLGTNLDPFSSILEL